MSQLYGLYICSLQIVFVNQLLYNVNKEREGMNMAMKVRTLLAARNMSIAELSRRVKAPCTQQNISVKLKRENLSEQDLISFAEACNATFEGTFTLKDSGEKI